MLKSALFYSIHTLSDLSLLLINSSDHHMTKTKVRSAKRLAFHTGICLAGPHSCIGFGCKWIYDKIHPPNNSFHYEWQVFCCLFVSYAVMLQFAYAKYE